MAHTTASDGVRLAYEVVGRRGGEPVLMIQGLGADRLGWTFQRLAFAPRYRTIAFDNRGVGGSDKPYGAYSLEQMADDAATVLDAAGVESAHVMGASMGGAISQVLALRHPHRVRSLVLACTACRHHPWRREMLAEWGAIAQERGMSELQKRAMRWVVGPRSLRRFAPAIGLIGPFAFRAPSHGFYGQVRAILDHQGAGPAELGAITVPTLVVVGSQDILTPRGDSEELAELIPGAELVVIARAAHGLFVEHASTYNHVVLDFLARVQSGEAGLGTRRPVSAA